jgi:alkanesulfonate monooxygenase SsuD/methylene tetrahydromethanopterin reductase-like flavin-dependent oxidoreductase (luciferase family)
VRFGLKVNPRGWGDAAQWAATADEAGFDSLWTGDNLRHPRDPAVPVHDGPAMLAAWAATTTRIKVGLLVANMIFRQPTVLAKQAVTLDHISTGRFQLGIGSGLWPTDHDMSGTPVWSARERTDRLSEFVGIVDRLLRGDVSDHSGAHYAYHDAAMAPASVQERVPLIVAANAARSLAVVADHADGWVTFTGTASEEDFHQASVERSRKLEQLCLKRDRDPRTPRRILLAYGSMNPWASTDSLARIADRYRTIGFDEIVCFGPTPSERPVFDKIAGRLSDLRQT